VQGPEKPVLVRPRADTTDKYVRNQPSGTERGLGTQTQEESAGITVEERLRGVWTLARESASPAVLVDAEGVIRAWNSAAGSWLGIPAWETSVYCRADPIASDVVVRLDLRGVPVAGLRHLPDHGGEGPLQGIVNSSARLNR